eukprot:1283325-Alexandrium_andersonii.AAC.1
MGMAGSRLKTISPWPTADAASLSRPRCGASFGAAPTIVTCAPPTPWARLGMIHSHCELVGLPQLHAK